MQGSHDASEALDTALRGIDVVYSRPRQRWEDYVRDDVEPTRVLAEAVLAHGVKRFVYTGTIDSYDSADARAVIDARTPVDARIARRNLYARSKAACEALLQRMHSERGLPLVIFRPGVVIGAGSPPAHWGVGMFHSDTRAQLWGQGTTKLPLVLVDDVAEGLALALDARGIEGRTFLLTDDPLLSAREYVGEVAGRAQRIDATPTPISLLRTRPGQGGVKHLVHIRIGAPSYRDWDCRAHRARQQRHARGSAEARGHARDDGAGRHRVRGPPLLPLMNGAANPAGSAVAKPDPAGATGAAVAVAYLVNQYPKVSHTFIRREIRALEQQGVAVTRFALRGWDADVTDRADIEERARTRYVLEGGPLPLAGAVVATILRAPIRFARALSIALRMSRRSPRSWPYHLIYLAEAAWLCQQLRAAGVDHLHAHFGTNGAEVALLVRELGGPPYSFTVHGPEEFDAPESLHLRAKIEKAAFVIAISSFGRSQLYRWIAVDQWPKVRVVHCGLDAQFDSSSVRTTVAAARLVCVGRLCEQKGQLLLLDAVKIVVDRGKALTLVLAGDGELREAIEGRIAALGLQEHVGITGWIDSERVASKCSRRGRWCCQASPKDCRS